MRSLLCALVVIVSVASSSSGAKAASLPVRMSVAGELPFSEKELRDAVGVRLPLDDRASTELTVLGDETGVNLVWGDRRRTVFVGARSGAEAARLVALAAADLIDEAAPEALPPPEPGRPFWVSLLSGAVKGTGGEEQPFAATVTLGLVVPLPESFRVAVSVAWVHSHEPTSAVFNAGALRLGAGRAFGPVELYAGGVVEAYGLDGLETHGGFLVGGSLWGRASLSLWDGISAALDVGADVFANQVSAEGVGGPYYVSPRVGVWASAGLVFEIDR